MNLKLCTAFLVVTTLALPALARPEGPPRPGAHLSDERREQLRGEVQGKIQTFATVELASKLKLDQKRALELSDLIKAHLDRKEQTRLALRDEAKKLRELVDKNADDAALNAQMKRVLEAKLKNDDTQELFDATGKLLSVREHAQLVLEFPRVRAEIARMIREARPGGGGGGRGGDD
jgi:uncharacterized membrane-anchored protein YjiN (DUF445 family)